MTDHRGMRDRKERELQDRIARANRVGWPTLAFISILVLIVLTGLVWVTLGACTSLEREPLTLRQQIYRLDLGACF